MRPALLALALVGAAATGGCHSLALQRRVAHGDHEGAVREAQAMRRPPKGKAARAYAKALVALGRVDEARALLLRDFRKTGEVASMIALADLEASLGLVGLATLHYERAAGLEPPALRGRADVCELLRRRAQSYGDQGENLAADQDLRRAALLCPPAAGSPQAMADARVSATIRGRAGADARALRTLAGCADGSCAAGKDERASQLAVALASARAKGPQALREAARALRVQLPADDVVTLLRAELDGALGVDLVSQDELRAWLGDASVQELQAAVEGLVGGPEAAAYIRLRLGRLGPGYALPVAEKEAGSEAAYVTTVLDALDAQGRGALGWRVLAMIGDLPGAEMSLAAGLGPREGGGAITPAQDAVPLPSHWGARVPLRSETLALHLVLARMRGASGRVDQALEITRFALAEARARGFQAATRAAEAEAHDALADGRPWQAMAIADAVGGLEAVSAAAAGAILLQRAACADGCGEADERVLVERALGAAWTAEREAILVELATRRAFAPPSLGPGCPTPGEVLASDAVGPLAEALRGVRSAGAAAAPEALRAAIEADLSLACAGGYVTPLMAQGGQRVGAQALLDNLSQGPDMIASAPLALLAELAMITGNGEQARVMAIAAAASSPRPQRVWARMARFSRLVDAREIELLALRQILLHDPEPAAERVARLGLLVRALRDANDAWAARESEVGQETLERSVAAYLEDLAPAERWWGREILARALADEAWSDERAAAIVRRALWPEPELAQAHPAASARLEAALRGRRGEAPGRVDPLSPAELALAAEGGEAPEHPSRRFLAAVELQELRLALAQGRGPAARRRAIALAVSGEPEARVRALRALLGDLAAAGEVDRRRAVEDLILAGLPALAPGASTPAPMVADGEVVVSLLFDIGQHVAEIPRRGRT